MNAAGSLRVPQPEPQVKPWIVLVGGFLGAGKTTLILSAIRELERRGLRGVAIFNDQGTDLGSGSNGTENRLKDRQLFVIGRICCHAALKSDLPHFRCRPEGENLTCSIS